MAALSTSNAAVGLSSSSLKALPPMSSCQSLAVPASLPFTAASRASSTAVARATLAAADSGKATHGTRRTSCANAKELLHDGASQDIAANQLPLAAQTTEGAIADQVLHAEAASWAVPRRQLAVLLATSVLGAATIGPRDAEAFQIGFSGPKEWLKSQKRKSAQYLLNPINLSRSRLQEAEAKFGLASSASELDEVKGLVKDASLTCLEEGNSSIELCTYKIILKNAASLLDDDDEAKVAAEAALFSVIESFFELNESLAEEGATEDWRSYVSTRFQGLQDNITVFEESIRVVLGL